MPDFATRVIRWQKQHGRHDLPWQNTRDAYRIWVSEIMLQQTQVATVIPYYQRFLKRFPDMASLAQVSLDDVLQQWSGLGYYSRARNLHRSAAEIVAQRGGCFPRDFEAVLNLPGIGRSTAAAICVFAYGDRRAILDGNVKRLLARCCGVAGYPGNPQVEAKLWRKAGQLVPQRDVEAYTQGLLDLGTAVCVRGKPRCDDCPLQVECVAHHSGRVHRLPAPRLSKRRPQRETEMLVLLHNGEVLLEKRAPSGIWGGMWSLPEIVPGADIGAACVQRYGATVEALDELPTIAHGFTHFKLDIRPRRYRVIACAARAAAPGQVWLSVADAIGAAIPAPVRRILAQL